MEVTPKIPTSLLRQSRIVMNEPAPGLRANLLELLNAIPTTFLEQGPNEKIRVFFLLCWLQAVMVQRLRYAPLATTKVYDFNDSDFRAALQRVESWVDTEARGRSNLSPDSLPWSAIRLVLSHYALGGRVDVDQDQAVLDSLIGHLFSPKSYESQFELAPGVSATALPDGTSISTFEKFASSLPEVEQPSFLGLPSSAATVVAISEGKSSVTAQVMYSHIEITQGTSLWTLCEKCRAWMNARTMIWKRLPWGWMVLPLSPNGWCPWLRPASSTLERSRRFVSIERSFLYFLH